MIPLMVRLRTVGPMGELLAVAEVFDDELNHVATTALRTGGTDRCRPARCRALSAP